MEACTKVMRGNEEVISALGSIPEWPACGDELDGASHHARGLERQGQPIGGEVTGGVDGGKEPMSFSRVHGPDGRAGHEERVKEDLCSKHVAQATWIFLHHLFVVPPR